MGAERAVSLSAAFANCPAAFNPEACGIKRFVLPKVFYMR